MENNKQIVVEGQKPQGKHLVLVVYPFQGHINPMLQLVTILNSKGFTITIVHPKFNSPNPLNYPDFAFVVLLDSFSEGRARPGNFVGTVGSLNESCEKPFREWLEKMVREEEDEEKRVCCVVYDGLLHFAQTVATHLKLPGISLRTSAAASLLIYSAIPRPHGQGYLSIHELLSQGPKHQSHDLNDLLFSMTSAIPSDDLLDLKAKITKAKRSSSAIIVNALHFLEEQVLPTLQQHFPSPIFSIGPFHKLAPKSFSTTLFDEDSSCLTWLDKQAPQSVLYVSFGSLVSFDQKDIEEIAWGLANSDQPFLWVVRPGAVRGFKGPDPLPDGFGSKVGQRGCVVKWVPQKEVLGHRAIGGFWTHCGWNSILESVCDGVPLRCRPFFGDQGVNARYVTHVWKIGLELEDSFEREKIEKAVREFMKGEEGVEMRKRAKELKERARLCLNEDGSTYNSLNDLAKLISSF